MHELPHHKHLKAFNLLFGTSYLSFCFISITNLFRRTTHHSQFVPLVTYEVILMVQIQPTITTTTTIYIIYNYNCSPFPHNTTITPKLHFARSFSSLQKDNSPFTIRQLETNWRSIGHTSDSGHIIPYSTYKPGNHHNKPSPSHPRKPKQ